MTAAEAWRLLQEALAGRVAAPPLFPERPWPGSFPDGGDPRLLLGDRSLPPALQLAAAVIMDRVQGALTGPASDPQTHLWRAVALRRTGEFQQARRLFREVGARPFFPQLFHRALALLEAGGPGYRWAGAAAAHLSARGTWDPVWFVDACASVYTGRLSHETAELLEEIQRAELQLMLLEATG